MRYPGIEIRLTLDGDPVITGDSNFLYYCAKYAGLPVGEWIRAAAWHTCQGEIRLEIRPAELGDWDDELAELADVDQADEHDFAPVSTGPDPACARCGRRGGEHGQGMEIAPDPTRDPLDSGGAGSKQTAAAASPSASSAFPAAAAAAPGGAAPRLGQSGTAGILTEPAEPIPARSPQARRRPGAGIARIARRARFLSGRIAGRAVPR